jgi:hypothetical protein
MMWRSKTLSIETSDVCDRLFLSGRSANAKKISTEDQVGKLSS